MRRQKRMMLLQEQQTMSSISSSSTTEAQLRLDFMRLQLNWLEREMLMLRKTLSQTATPAQPTRNFAALRGAWAGIVVSEQDIAAARLALPEGL
jgi:hypothetical protein